MWLARARRCGRWCIGGEACAELGILGGQAKLGVLCMEAGKLAGGGVIGVAVARRWLWLDGVLMVLWPGVVLRLARPLVVLPGGR